MLEIDVVWIDQPRGKLSGYFSVDVQNKKLHYVGGHATYRKLTTGTRLALEVGKDTYFVELEVVNTPVSVVGVVDEVISLRSCEFKPDHEEKRRLSEEIARICNAICEDRMDREVEDLRRLLDELQDIENGL